MVIQVLSSSVDTLFQSPATRAACWPSSWAIEALMSRKIGPGTPIQLNMHTMIYLVGGLELFFHILGISESQLTSSYFSEGLKPPTRQIYIYIYIHIHIYIYTYIYICICVILYTIYKLNPFSMYNLGNNDARTYIYIYIWFICKYIYIYIYIHIIIHLHTPMS